MTIDEDYVPGDEFDWDRNDSSQYCKHGTFIGSWAGPDLMCGWCEDGVSVAEMQASLRAQAIRRDQATVDEYANVHRICIEVYESRPYDYRVASALMDVVAQPHVQAAYDRLQGV